MKDTDRIIYSSPFRRLQDKTQVHPFPGTDYIRTRLTHSLEVSTVGRALGLAAARYIIPNYKLDKGDDRFDSSDFGNVLAAACLAHDIGNPPFGHAGEEAIRHWYSDKGQKHLTKDVEKDEEKLADFLAFEGNAQGFRILTRLAGWREKGGLRLSCATIGTFMKYPRGSCAIDPETRSKSARSKFGYFQEDKYAFTLIADTLGLPAKEEDLGDRVRHPLSYLVEAADDICYLIVDLEDGHKYKKLSYSQVFEFLEDIIKNSPTKDDLKRLESIEDNADKIAYLRAKSIGALVGEVDKVFRENIGDLLNGEFSGSLMSHIVSVDTIAKIRELSEKILYSDHRKIEAELAGYEVIHGLLKIYTDSFSEWEHVGYDLNKISSRHQKVIQLFPDFQLMPPDRYEWLLRVNDYISGMADRFILAQFQKLKGIRIDIGRD
ncbi:MAG: dNTP triphosphohydrolase [Proteobacteria bacterium]|nr:dNTP triphosphohydrolase [Pseudomonadota bacterium]